MDNEALYTVSAGADLSGIHDPSFGSKVDNDASYVDHIADFPLIRLL